jgi:hypothetical protein
MQRLMGRKSEKQESQEILSPRTTEVNPSAIYYNQSYHEKKQLKYKHSRQIYTETVQDG